MTQLYGVQCHTVLSRRQATTVYMCDQNALQKLPLRYERETDALAIVNHHSYRFNTLSDSLDHENTM